MGSTVWAPDGAVDTRIFSAQIKLYPNPCVHRRRHPHRAFKAWTKLEAAFAHPSCAVATGSHQQQAAGALAPAQLKLLLIRLMSAARTWHDDLVPLSFFDNCGASVLSFGNSTRATPAYALRVLERLPALRGLDFTACFGLTDEHVAQIVAACPQLEYVNLTNCRRVGDGSVEALLRLARLRHVDLGGCVNLSRAAPARLLTHANAGNFTGLGLSGVEGITEALVEAVAATCQRLERLSLGYYGGGDGPVIAAVSANAGLRVLHLHWCERLTDAALYAAADACPRLFLVDVTGIDRMTADGVHAVLAAHGAPRPAAAGRKEGHHVKHDLDEHEWLTYYSGGGSRAGSAVVGGGQDMRRGPAVDAAGDVAMASDDICSAAAPSGKSGAAEQRDLHVIGVRFSGCSDATKALVAQLDLDVEVRG
jgi:hypothetical protein